MNKNAQSGNNWYQMKLRLLREENNKLKIKTLQGVGKCEGAPQHYLNEDANMIKIIKKLY